MMQEMEKVFEKEEKEREIEREIKKAILMIFPSREKRLNKIFQNQF